ncbi:10506_t:CDS:1 [Dentiscutata erythropus]|uniref:10506_t:CDS:1 n=1 Tax=Dentiscutata erythropus TaxID=1348616 RepID=A0A9N9DJL7_9GLOM|nr:10506_t:CDS:1 [Dentiscutata erythropus]
MNTQYCSAHKSIPYKVIFEQLPHCNTNLINLYENEELSNNNALISEGSQLTIISDISSEMFESEFHSNIDIDELQNITDPYDQDISEQNNLDNQDIDISVQKIYNNLLSLYLETREGSKNSLAQKLTKIINSDDNFEFGKGSKNLLASKVIEIIDSGDDLSKTRCYTVKEKKK